MRFFETITVLVVLSCSSLSALAQQNQQQPPVNEPTSQQIQVLAVVNGQQITRNQVATECMRRFGEEVLESIINKQLVYAECQARGIVITEKDINDEIVKDARNFNMSDERYIELIKTRRNIPVDRFKNDIVWSEIALRRLAASELQVTPDEIRQRMEFEFGPKVNVREIVLNSREEAESIWQQATAAPQEFERLAKQYSVNTNSAAGAGMLLPVRRNSGLPEFENIAFSLQPGQISNVFQIENQFIILKCVSIDPAVELAPDQVAEVNERIVEEIENDKLAAASTELFKKLQTTVRITNVMNDPELSQQMPEIAAMVDNAKISKRFLAEECIARYGQQMLETEINRMILMQSLQSKNYQVTQDDLNEEITRVASTRGFVGGDNTVDVEKWLKFVTQNDESKIDFYIEDEVWPSVALRKLVEQSVTVGQDDLQKGYEANYGPRVEALAIVLSENRTALKVWEMAKNNLSKEYFGELAHQYSVEPLSRNNYGQVPPIQMHGGRPQLEKEAFGLEAGELSKIIQAGQHWIIMYCLGRTEPRVNDFEAVRDELQKHIFEKKLYVAMADEFDRLRETSQIDNFLAGTSQAGGAVRTGAQPPATRTR